MSDQLPNSGVMLIDEVENERQWREYRRTHPLPDDQRVTPENMTRLPRDYTEPPKWKDPHEGEERKKNERT